MANVKTTCSIVEPWPGFDDRRDELLHLDRVEVAGDGAPEDLLGRLFRVARPAGGVDDRHVERSTISRSGNRSVTFMPRSRRPGFLGMPVFSRGELGRRRRRGSGRERDPEGVGCSGHRGRQSSARRTCTRPRGVAPARSRRVDLVAAGRDRPRPLQGVGHDLVEAHRRALGGQPLELVGRQDIARGRDRRTGRGSGRRSRRGPSRSSAAGGGPRPTAGPPRSRSPTATATIARSSSVRVTPDTSPAS